MSDPHRQRVASYQDASTVYSYGYGALRELCRQLDQDLVAMPEFTNLWKQIVAAVEFRVAEIGAEVLAGQIKLKAAPPAVTFNPAIDAASGIYDAGDQSPERGNPQ